MPPSHSQVPSCVQERVRPASGAAGAGSAAPADWGTSDTAASARGRTAAGTVTAWEGGSSTVTAGSGRMGWSGSTSRTASTSHST